MKLRDLLPWKKKPTTRPTGRRRNFFGAFNSGRGGFDGARLDRMTEDWNPGNRSPGSIHLSDGGILRERARDLVLNNPLARSAVDSYIANVVECGITPKPNFTDRGQRRKWTSGWNHWQEHEGDITGHQQICELSALWLEEIIVGGGCLLYKRVLPASQMNGRRLRAAIELIPEERFADDQDTFLHFRAKRKSANPITRGVELDAATGRPVAYWLKPGHPNDAQVGTSVPGADLLRVPASEAHYAFFRRRIGQYRGYTLFHAVIMWLWKLGYYTDNELMASAIKSCFAALVESEDGDQDFPDLVDGDPDGPITDVWGNLLEKLQPGIIGRVRTGETVKGVGPNIPPGDSVPWLMLIQMSIAIGMGLSYSELMRDYSQGNFSSQRMSANADKKRYRPMQRFTVHHFARPVYEHFARWAVIAGVDGFPSRTDFAANIDEWLSTSWQMPGWESANPKDDATANEKNLSLGLTTRQRIIAGTGGDWEESDEQRARELANEERLGLKFGAVKAQGPEPEPAPESDQEEAADG